MQQLEQGRQAAASRGQVSMPADPPVGTHGFGARMMSLGVNLGLAFIQESVEQLRAGERLWLSTEILESSFALYKQLEHQHSKGGFTSLLASFATLLKPTTPAEVAKAFVRVPCQRVKQWITQHLGTTVSSRRTKAYREYQQATRATNTAGLT